MFTNILIVTFSRIAFTKNLNLRNDDAIFTNILIVTVLRIAFTKNRNLRKFRRMPSFAQNNLFCGKNVYMCYNYVHLDILSDISTYDLL